MKSKVCFVLGLLISNLSYAAIPKVEDKNYSVQIKTAQDASLPMSTRWQALVKAAEQAGPNQIAEISKFSQSNDWFMRNAALVALEKINPSFASDQAKELIKDKALVVRSAAVEVLAKRNTLEVKRLLAEELDKSYNFSGKQSLWIRPQIMKALAKTATADDRQFVARYLFDQDKKVAALSAAALEKISSVRFEGDDKEKVQQWQKFVKNKNWL